MPLAIGFIRYALLCTAPDVCIAPCVTREYKSDPGVDYSTAVKDILSNWRTKEMFLDYGGDKEFAVKSYIHPSFNTNPDDSKKKSGYV